MGVVLILRVRAANGQHRHACCRAHYICASFLAAVVCGCAPCLLRAVILDRRTVAFAFLIPVSLLLLSFHAIRESSRWLLTTWDAVGDKLTSGQHMGRGFDAELERIVRRLGASRMQAAVATAAGRRATVASVASGSPAAVPGFLMRTLALSVLLLSLFTILFVASQCTEEDTSQAPPPPFWPTAVLVIPRAFSLVLSARLLHGYERKRALLLGLPISCAVVAALSLVEFSSQRYVVIVLSEMLFSSVLVNLAFAGVYSLELYTTDVRATGFAAIYFASLAGVAAMCLLDEYDRTASKMCALSLVVGALLLVNQLPETKGVRLQETPFDLTDVKRYSLSSASRGFAEAVEQIDPSIAPTE
ncbi:hypothetical protein V5799_008621 [Amblyomma americanum]|uniref:Uncharacterized protein n=1 Tax=Amblyomma americanum TaxID=6943 RepID=A0AAQ4FDH4_AMBAM